MAGGVQERGGSVLRMDKTDRYALPSLEVPQIRGKVNIAFKSKNLT